MDLEVFNTEQYIYGDDFVMQNLITSLSFVYVKHTSSLYG